MAITAPSPLEFTPQQYLEAVRPYSAFDGIDEHDSPAIVAVLNRIGPADRDAAVDRLKKVTYGQLYANPAAQKAELLAAMSTRVPPDVLQQLEAAHWPELPSSKMRYTQLDALAAINLVSILPDSQKPALQQVMRELATNPYDPQLPDTKRQSLIGLLTLGKMSRVDSQAAVTLAEPQQPSRPEGLTLTAIYRTTRDLVTRLTT